MKSFKTAHGEMVDLEDISLYDYLPKNVKSIRDMIHQEIGYYYCYVNYWHPRWDKKQEERVKLLIEKYTEEWRNNITDLQWYRETLFIFQDEIENMC